MIVTKLDAETGIPDGAREVPDDVVLDQATFEVLKRALFAHERTDLIYDYGRIIDTGRVRIFGSNCPPRRPMWPDRYSHHQEVELRYHSQFCANHSWNDQ